MYEVSSGQKPQLNMALGKDKRGNDFKIDQFKKSIITNKQDSECLDPSPDDFISSPHSNAYIDLNGDCMPDIFL